MHIPGAVLKVQLKKTHFPDSNVSSGRAQLAGVTGSGQQSPGTCRPRAFCPSGLMGAEVVRTPSGERQRSNVGGSAAGVRLECDASTARGLATYIILFL